MGCYLRRRAIQDEDIVYDWQSIASSWSYQNATKSGSTYTFKPSSLDWSYRLYVDASKSTISWASVKNRRFVMRLKFDYTLEDVVEGGYINCCFTLCQSTSRKAYTTLRPFVNQDGSGHMEYIVDPVPWATNPTQVADSYKIGCTIYVYTGNGSTCVISNASVKIAFLD